MKHEDRKHEEHEYRQKYEDKTLNMMKSEDSNIGEKMGTSMMDTALRGGHSLQPQE